MKSIRLSDEAYTRLENRVWDVVTTSPLEGSWWDTVYETPQGNLFVCMVDDSNYTMRRLFSRKQLLVAFLSLESQTHCGNYHLLEEPDSCSADTILQQALFGKLIYG
jgi:gluconate kinase